MGQRYDINGWWAELKCIMSKPKHSVTAARLTSPKLSPPAGWQWKRPRVEIVEIQGQNSLHHWVASGRTVGLEGLISTYGFNWMRNKPFFGMSSRWDLGVFYYCSINLIYLNRTRQDKRKLRRKSNFLENLTETYLDLVVPKINQLPQQWMLV